MDEPSATRYQRWLRNRRRATTSILICISPPPSSKRGSGRLLRKRRHARRLVDAAGARPARRTTSLRGSRPAARLPGGRSLSRRSGRRRGRADGIPPDGPDQRGRPVCMLPGTGLPAVTDQVCAVRGSAPRDSAGGPCCHCPRDLQTWRRGPHRSMTASTSPPSPSTMSRRPLCSPSSESPTPRNPVPHSRQLSFRPVRRPFVNSPLDSPTPRRSPAFSPGRPAEAGADLCGRLIRGRHRRCFAGRGQNGTQPLLDPLTDVRPGSAFRACTHDRAAVHRPLAGMHR